MHDTRDISDRFIISSHGFGRQKNFCVVEFCILGTLGVICMEWNASSFKVASNIDRIQQNFLLFGIEDVNLELTYRSKMEIICIEVLKLDLLMQRRYLHNVVMLFLMETMLSQPVCNCVAKQCTSS